MSTLYAQETVTFGEYRLGLGFTSVETGNLGLHVGDDVSGVQCSRALLDEELGLAEGTIAYLNQVHGTHVATDEELESISSRLSSGKTGAELLQSAPVADAAISANARALAVMVADCVPLVFCAPRAEGVPLMAVAHAGRRGLLDGVIQRTLEKLETLGALDIHVWIGPSICGKCYEIPDTMHKESVALYPELASKTHWGTPALDLPAAAVAIAKRHPLVSEVSTEFNACTFENKTLFSHRRGAPHGRIAGIIWKEEQ